MGSFANPPPVVFNLTTLNTTTDSVTIGVTIAMTNPSVLYGSMGPVTLAFDYLGVTLSSASIADLVLTVSIVCAPLIECDANMASSRYSKCSLALTTLQPRAA